VVALHAKELKLTSESNSNSKEDQPLHHNQDLLHVVSVGGTAHLHADT